MPKGCFELCALQACLSFGVRLKIVFKGLGFEVAGFRVSGLGCRVQGLPLSRLRFRVEGLGLIGFTGLGWGLRV